MSLTASTRMKELGTLLEPVPNSVFSVEDPAKVWLVLAGTLDLFLADIREDDSIGPRSHMLQLQEGGALFGFNRGKGARAGLLANPGQDTKLLCLDKRQLQRTSDRLQADPLIALIEQWITTISTVAVDRIAPKNTIRLDETKEVKFDEN